jgi:ABC-type transporter Mla MlaB component
MQAVAVPARIGVDNAVQVLASLREACRGMTGEALALDLAPLQEFDSSALSLLLQLAREQSGRAHDPDAGGAVHGTAEGADGRRGGAASAVAPALFLLNPPEKLRELADLYGVAGMLFGAAGNQVGQPRQA